MPTDIICLTPSLNVAEEALQAARILGAKLATEQREREAEALRQQQIDVPDYAAYIYAHESTTNPDAWNTEGCYGLGQDCSGWVAVNCGSNVACQHEFFTQYATERYGGWAGAYAFWVANHWW